MGPILDMVAISNDVVEGMMCEELGKHVNTSLLCLVRAHYFASVVTPRGYKSKRSPLHTLTSSRTNNCCLAPPSLCMKREREREGDFLGLESIASPSLSRLGRTQLDHFQGHAGSPVEPHEPGVHDGGGAGNLPRARASLVPSSDDGICGGFHGIL
jgi:hypothetical protein